jgi:hypothetical protein
MVDTSIVPAEVVASVRKKRRKQLFRGEGWFARLPGAEALMKLDILDVCGSVVTVRDHDGYSDAKQHYEIDRIEWVEQFKYATR